MFILLRSHQVTPANCLLCTTNIQLHVIVKGLFCTIALCFHPYVILNTKTASDMRFYKSRFFASIAKDSAITLGFHRIKRTGNNIRTYLKYSNDGENCDLVENRVFFSIKDILKIIAESK